MQGLSKSRRTDSTSPRGILSLMRSRTFEVSLMHNDLPRNHLQISLTIAKPSWAAFHLLRHTQVRECATLCEVLQGYSP